MNFRSKFTALSTILKKEIIRILRIWPQTLVPPIITTSLYFVIFGKVLFNNREILVSGESISYIEYLIPGLIIMSIITNAYGSSSSSLFGCKFQKNIEELLVAPIAAWIIILGFTLGGVFRGLINGIMIFITAILFAPITVYSPTLSLTVALLTAMFFSLTGIINAIFAKTFDDISWFPAFILTPMVYLGGVFFSISMLPDTWRFIVTLNPVYHFVDIFRHNLIGVGESHFLSLGGIIIVNILLFILTTFLFQKKLQK
jgi:ABC-2 type transport system permease protein